MPRVRTATRLPIVALAAVLAVALVVGCGEDNGAFEKDFEPVNSELLALTDQISAAVASKPPDTVLAGLFLGFSTRLGDTGERVDALEPPEGLRDEVRTLSRATVRLTTDLRAIGEAARAGKSDVVRATTQALARDLKAAGEARRALARETGARVDS